MRLFHGLKAGPPLPSQGSIHDSAYEKIFDGDALEPTAGDGAGRTRRPRSCANSSPWGWTSGNRPCMYPAPDRIYESSAGTVWAMSRTPSRARWRRGKAGCAEATSARQAEEVAGERPLRHEVVVVHVGAGPPGGRRSPRAGASRTGGSHRHGRSAASRGGRRRWRGPRA